MMKVIKKHNETKSIKDQFKVGQTITWWISFFDGRSSEIVRYKGDIVKINRITIDVQLENKDIVRLDETEISRAKIVSVFDRE